MKGKPTTTLCRNDLAANAVATVQALVGNKSSTVSLHSTSRRYSIATRSKRYDEANELERTRKVTRGDVAKDDASSSYPSDSSLQGESNVNEESSVRYSTRLVKKIRRDDFV